MSEPQQPTYLVSAYRNPVAVRINGKANYLNCNAFREFIEKVIADGRNKIVLDFDSCTGMDSTFLGILAGTALELKQKSPPGDLTLCHLSERNNELICNLGLQILLNIGDNVDAENKAAYDSLKDEQVSDASKVLEAHENLAEVNADNLTKFQDVIAFLKNQVESGEDEHA